MIFYVLIVSWRSCVRPSVSVGGIVHLAHSVCLPSAVQSARVPSPAFLIALTNGVHRNDSFHRTFVMKPWLTVTLPDAASLADVIIEKRRQRILDMAAALSAMFGDAALPIAEGQPGTFDVGGRSGIRWQELADELRAAKLPHTIAIPATP